MKYIDKIMKTARNKIVQTKGSQISLQQSHSVAMSLQVEGEKVKQCRIPGLCSELGFLHVGFWSSRRGRRGEPLKAPSALLVTEGSSTVEEGKWGVESKRQSEGLKS